MSASRPVELLGAHRARGADNAIAVNVLLTYLKDRPIAVAELTRMQALSLAADLVRLVEQDFRQGRAS